MIKVKLRKKAITNERTSLYLDFYPAITHPDTGKPTRREFLGLYMFNRTKTPADKEQNAETLNLAETIRAKRQIEVQNGAYGFLSKRERTICFVDYFRDLTAKRKGSNVDNWTSTLHHLTQFTGGTLKLSDLTERRCVNFRDYLLTTSDRRSKRNEKELSTNSAVSYFSKFKAALKQAYKDGLLTVDLNARVDSIKPDETHREYLTLEELQCLAKTDCPSMPLLKKAGMFAALTGLRLSDIKAMTWGHIRHSESIGYHIHFTQQKTKGVEVMPISELAVSVLGERQNDDQLVLAGLKYSAHLNNVLRRWVADAGVKGKHFSFHCFRHTFATLQLALGTDLYTLAKLLGHREFKTTQIYGKVGYKAKRTAADRIKIDLEEIQ